MVLKPRKVEFKFDERSLKSIEDLMEMTGAKTREEIPRVIVHCENCGFGNYDSRKQKKY